MTGTVFAVTKRMEEALQHPILIGQPDFSELVRSDPNSNEPRVKRRLHPSSTEPWAKRRRLADDRRPSSRGTQVFQARVDSIEETTQGFVRIRLESAKEPQKDEKQGKNTLEQPENTVEHLQHSKNIPEQEKQGMEPNEPQPGPSSEPPKPLNNAAFATTYPVNEEDKENVEPVLLTNTSGATFSFVAPAHEDPEEGTPESILTLPPFQEINPLRAIYPADMTSEPMVVLPMDPSNIATSHSSEILSNPNHSMLVTSTPASDANLRLLDVAGNIDDEDEDAFGGDPMISGQLENLRDLSLNSIPDADGSFSNLEDINISITQWEAGLEIDDNMEFEPQSSSENMDAPDPAPEQAPEAVIYVDVQEQQEGQQQVQQDDDDEESETIENIRNFIANHLPGTELLRERLSLKHHICLPGYVLCGMTQRVTLKDKINHDPTFRLKLRRAVHLRNQARDMNMDCWIADDW